MFGMVRGGLHFPLIGRSPIRSEDLEADDKVNLKCAKKLTRYITLQKPRSAKSVMQWAEECSAESLKLIFGWQFARFPLRCTVFHKSRCSPLVLPVTDRTSVPVADRF